MLSATLPRLPRRTASLLAALVCVLPAAAQIELRSPLADDPLARARQLLVERHPDQAEAVLREYLGTHELSAPARWLLGDTLVHQNKPKDALAEFTHAARLEPPSSDNLVEVAHAYVLMSGYKEAAHWLQNAVALNPANTEAWYSLGRVQYTDQNFNAAIGSFEHVLALEPHSVRAENNRGLALEALNRTDEAVAAYRNALAWQAGAGAPSEQPMINLATVLIHRAQFTEALPLLIQAEAAAPANPQIREPIEEQLGHLYLQQSRLPEAAAAFERALLLTPNSGPLHFLLGQTYRRMGLKDKSEEQFRLSAAIAGNHSTPEK